MAKNKQEYYEQIEILEAVKIEEELLVKDFSKYFDVKIENIDWLKKEIEFIEEYLYKKLKDLNKYWQIEEKRSALNEREYKLKIDLDWIDELFENLVISLKDNFRKNHFVYKKDTKILKIDNKDIKLCENIKRMFNCMSFFQDHESLFSKENDFESSDMKALYLNVKDSDDKYLNNLETKISKLDNKDKFFVKVKLDSKISWDKKYDYVFFTERWSYFKWSLKNNWNENG